MDVLAREPDVPSPPCLTPPLKVAIVGRSGAGKTTLLSHIASTWGSPDPQRTRPLPVTRTPNPLFARLLGSRIGVLASRGIRFLTGFRRLFRRPVECTTLSLGNSGTAWDPLCGSGPIAVALAVNRQVDVVLFVTRLDDGRVSRADRMHLVELVRCFGEKVLDKTILVLTHGWATPPADLTFKDFVRGRRDLLWQYVSEMLPPVELPRPSAASALQCGDQSEAGSAESREHALSGREMTDVGGCGDEGVTDNEGVRNVVCNAEIGSPARSEGDGYVSPILSAEDQLSSQDPLENDARGMEIASDIQERPTEINGRSEISAPVEDEDEERVLQSQANANRIITEEATRTDDGNDTGGQQEDDDDIQFKIRPDKLDELFGDTSTDDSVSGLPDDVIGKFWDILVHPDDDRVFADPFKPLTVVVELSETCPKDDRGQKTLPDGAAWLPTLLRAVSSKAQWSRRLEAEEAERTREAMTVRAGTRQAPRFWKKLRGMLRSLSNDGFRMFVAEIAIIVLCLQVGRSVKKWQERRRQRVLDAIDDDDDVLLEMSDEEYEKLTKPSDDPKPFVLYDDMEKDVDLDRETETELFGSEEPKSDQEAVKQAGKGKEQESKGDQGSQNDTRKEEENKGDQGRESDTGTELENKGDQGPKSDTSKEEERMTSNDEEADTK